MSARQCQVAGCSRPARWDVTKDPDVMHELFGACSWMLHPFGASVCDAHLPTVEMRSPIDRKEPFPYDARPLISGV